MTPAFRLVVACCRWPASDERASAIHAAAAAVGDWKEVVRLAERHRIEPLVANGLRAADQRVPSALQAAVERHRALSLRDIAESLKIAGAFDAAGIEHRFLKGAALGVAAYGSPLIKRSWDIDLLVHPEQAVTAAALLGVHGYAPVMPPRVLDQQEYRRWSRVSKEAELRSPGGSVVELHWRVSDHGMLLSTLDAASPARRVALLGDHAVATLDDDANLAYLAVHGTAHAWSRLKWLADFHALLGSVGDGNAVLERARGFGVGHAVDVALALAPRLLGDASRSKPAGLARFALRALASDDQSTIETATSRARWSLMSGLAYRWKEMTIRLRGSNDRLDHPLAPRWQFLYPVLRVPFWVYRKWRSVEGT